MSLYYDPEWIAQAGPSLKGQAEVLPVGDVATRRSRFADLFVRYQFTAPDDIDLQVLQAPADDGHVVEIFHLAPKALKEKLDKPSPAVLHIHGGGFIAVNAHNVLGSLVPLVRASQVPFFSVEYRWAPEHPYPTPLEDCWTGLQYLHAHTDALGIDPKRIAVMGESAGGGLAAGLALLARERSLSPPLAKQILIYPMLDDRTATDHSGGLSVFSLNDVFTGWQAYLGKNYLGEDVSPCAVPARVTDVAGLPELYLDVGQLDLFLHENLDFATKFLRAGIQTELHIYPGVIHAFQRWSPDARVVKQAIENRARAVHILYSK
ncbi:hypothetical protein SEUCBS140593_006789 [Sporothrix eucalyptigena]|uniref:Alpha/beta hydrolase fold-3 domain-containing protein n=1 Tax=Sporothrix eucalyptigena TaxID=1812306 RepID=A0ABP0C8V0_9PEZI